ncbi:hypothetical protein K2173_001062 [Erythroxylum novogranatense]|uniref:Uncharacterized protein n=1 Tax=Erythroxylum novogranatense TaxID=1862640 RepID=A0AAV8SIE1_9ROSI|nr:hypothetical protein K2173_001062 [Erythroxylum novogranatense]
MINFTTRGGFNILEAKILALMNHEITNTGIFLRDLISNAFALYKIRFLSLTDKEVKGEGENKKLKIEIKLDIEKELEFMTEEDLIKNMGTISKLRTYAFMEKMQISGTSISLDNLELVEIISKHNNDKQYIWESKANGAFAIFEDTWNESLGRGPEIRLHLRDEAREYLKQSKLKDLVKKYSKFINFPIYLCASKEDDVEVPTDEDKSSDEKETTTS